MIESSSSLPSCISADSVSPAHSSPDRIESALGMTLPTSASKAFLLFCESEASPEWMSIIRMAHAIDRQEDGKPTSTSFVANLVGASIGYTLNYKYCDVTKTVTWSTSRGTSTQISGQAQFTSLGPKACMMQYSVMISTESRLPALKDSMYNDHPASAVLSDFREYIDRQIEH